MVKWIFLFLLLFPSFFSTLSANEVTYIDSLKRVELESKIDTVRLNALSKLAIAYYDSAYDKSINYWKAALEIASRIRNREKMAHIHHQIGFILFQKGEFQQALHEYKNSLSVHEFINNRNGIGQIYNDIGLVYKTWGKYEIALENFLKGLAIFEEIKSSFGISMVSNNIGQIYYYKQDYTNAIKFFNTYLTVNQKLKYPLAVAGASNNIASAYMELEKYDDAYKYFEKAKNIYDSLGIAVGVAIISDNIGTLYSKTEKYVDALNNHLIALNHFKRIGSKTRMARTLNNIGYTYYKLNDYNNSIKFLLEAKLFASKLGQREVEKEVYSNLSDVLSAKNEHKEAFRYFKLMTSLKDSLLNLETKEKLLTLELQFDADKKGRELQFFQSKLKQQKNFTLIIGSLGTLFLLLLFFLVNENIKKGKTINKLSFKKTESYKLIENSLYKANSLNINSRICKIPCSILQVTSNAFEIEVISSGKTFDDVCILIPAEKKLEGFAISVQLLHKELVNIFEFEAQINVKHLVEHLNSKWLYINDIIENILDPPALNFIAYNSSQKSITVIGRSVNVWLCNGKYTTQLESNIETLLEINVEMESILFVLSQENNNFSNELIGFIDKTFKSLDGVCEGQIEVFCSAIETWKYSNQNDKKIGFSILKLNTQT